MDNYAAHKHPKVKAWLAANPRIHIHFTPTSGSWINLVEIWFGIIERQAIHRGTFASVRDLMIKMRAFINGWNDRCQPFVWTKTADQILKKADRKTISVSFHEILLDPVYGAHFPKLSAFLNDPLFGHFPLTFVIYLPGLRQ